MSQTMIFHHPDPTEPVATVARYVPRSTDQHLLWVNRVPVLECPVKRRLSRFKTFYPTTVMDIAKSNRRVMLRRQIHRESLGPLATTGNLFKVFYHSMRAYNVIHDETSNSLFKQTVRSGQDVVSAFIHRRRRIKRC